MSKELAQAFSEMQSVPAVELEYRLYYDAKGMPVSMSSHNHPVGNYIIITKALYDSANYNGRVIKGELIFDIPNQFRVQLKKSDSGMPVVKGHANLVVENEEYTDIEYYGRTN